MVEFTIVIVLQAALLAILKFGDIGFDKPGRYGLDFDDGRKLVVVYLGLLLYGLVRAIRKKRWRSALMQVLILCIFLALQFWPLVYNPRLNAADYQHLVGKSRVEAREALEWSRLLSSGATGSAEHGDFEFETYNGLQVLYSLEGEVIAVEAHTIRTTRQK